MNNTPFILLLTLSHLSIDGCMGDTRKECKANADKSDDWLLKHKTLTYLYMKKIGVENCAKVWSGLYKGSNVDFEVNEGSFCVSLYRQEEAATADYTREIMAKGLKLYDCAFNEVHPWGNKYCFLRTKWCEERRYKTKKGGGYDRVFGPPPPMVSKPANILTCNNPQARSAKGQTILSCISNMGRSGRSRGSQKPILKTDQDNKRLMKKMKNESARMKKDLLAIDAKYDSKKGKNINGRRSGKLASPTTPEYRIIVN